MDVVLSVRKLKFSYGESFSLIDVSFELNSGEVLFILGPNASGKTTLLKCILGIYDYKGSITVVGHEVKHLSRVKISRIIGYVPQMHRPSFPFKLVDFVTFGRTPYIGIFSTPSSEDYELAKRCLSELNLLKLCDVRYDTLSGGQLRLALIARALAQSPKLLLLDEPTANLDLRNKLIIENLIRKLKDRGMCVIVCSHDFNMAINNADKILLLKDGRMKFFGATNELLTSLSLLEEVFNVRIHSVNEYNGRKFIVYGLD